MMMRIELAAAASSSSSGVGTLSCERLFTYEEDKTQKVYKNLAQSLIEQYSRTDSAALR